MDCLHKSSPGGSSFNIVADYVKESGIHVHHLQQCLVGWGPSSVAPTCGSNLGRPVVCLHYVTAKTAACVQILMNAGAIIVGKVKLQAMIMREEPLECVEFTAPFNPRADGYQVPSGSSHASAAGISSYHWLDFSLGSDTNGSGRKPASYNGCFSIRRSTGIMNNEGVVGYFPQFDMPVFFGRDISRFSDFISVWLESILSITISTTALRIPENAMQQNKGSPPSFIEPCTGNVGKAISQDERDECWRRSEVYRHWLLEKVFKANSNDSMMIMILPIEQGQPNYRDAELPPYSLLSGYASLNMSPMMRAPEVTAPVGDIPYHSTVTEREEPLPITVSAIGAPGMDLNLVDMVEKVFSIPNYVR
ncbi:amidase signature enzyme [Melanomma pulvis-pyrius CBS 109.77]|uniref:Amidase signature enzyme n=1 Tax=Melanomma pulvis-pyrius CBS 109.77 TaxID=1314802 RepID=A0A6A6XQ82_9PLEO|nr:amidase signature enzyme [Melanomma pulvis-pyrius CBS 109.77]